MPKYTKIAPNAKNDKILQKHQNHPKTPVLTKSKNSVNQGAGSRIEPDRTRVEIQQATIRGIS